MKILSPLSPSVLLPFLLLIPALVIGQNTRFSDPDTVIQEHFWGNLYAEGGTTFFCDQPFHSKGFTLTAGYVYPLAEIRRSLECGTPSECRENNQYRQIASDMHNLIPVNHRIELKRRNARFADLDGGGRHEECGIRASAQYIDPPEHAKGDIARTVAYMVTTYSLPWAGNIDTFRQWNDIDPPDDTELSRNKRVAEIQGNDNPFVGDPSLITGL